MNKSKLLDWKNDRVSALLFVFSGLLIVYMPLHVFIVQSASLVTGGLGVWKAAKDILVFALVPLLVIIAYKRGLFKGKYKWHFLIGSLYVLLHLLYVVFDSNDHTYSAIVATVYNSRLLVYLLLGIVVGSAKEGKRYIKYLLTLAVIVATFVSVLGIFQYFLPHDILTNVGYSVERGVKPLFFIDDRPELPRIMSTLKDPNSLGAYLILPILATGYALFSTDANKKLFARPFRKGTLGAMMAIMLLALFFTFSRGALLGMILSIITILCIVTGERALGYIKRFWIIFAVLLVILGFLVVQFRNSAIVQDYIFHAAVSTNQEDPNEKRVTLLQESIEDVAEQPTGYGPGSAGLVSINNPQGGVLTENYYVQIAYEVGWLGIALFVAILLIIGYQLLSIGRKNPAAAVLFSALIAYLFYSLLIHLWSNEAVALQWWLLSGVTLGTTISLKRSE